MVCCCHYVADTAVVDRQDIDEPLDSVFWPTLEEEFAERTRAKERRSNSRDRGDRTCEGGDPGGSGKNGGGGDHHHRRGGGSSGGGEGGAHSTTVHRCVVSNSNFARQKKLVSSREQVRIVRRSKQPSVICFYSLISKQEWIEALMVHEKGLFCLRSSFFSCTLRDEVVKGNDCSRLSVRPA